MSFAALSTLPWWYLPGRIYFLLTFGYCLAFVTLRLCLIGWNRVLKQDPDPHWVKRSLALYSYRLVAIATLFTCYFLTLFMTASVGFLPGYTSWIPLLLGAFTGLARYRSGFLKAWYPKDIKWGGFVSGLIDYIPSLLAHIPGFSVYLVFVFLSINIPMPQKFVLLPLMAITLYGVLAFPVEIGKLFGFIKDPNPRFLNLCKKAEAETGCQLLGCGFVRLFGHNFVVWSWLRFVAMTERTLAILSDEEIYAFIVFEMAHLREDRWTLRLRQLVEWIPFAGFVLVVAVSYDPIAKYTSNWSSFWIQVAVFLVYMGVRSSSYFRKKVTNADDYMASLVGANVAARAIESLARINLVPLVMGRALKTHPDTYDRLLRLGYEPSYDKPHPPGKIRLVAPLLVVPLLFVLSWFLFSVALGLFHVPQPTKLLIKSMTYGQGRAKDFEKVNEEAGTNFDLNLLFPPEDPKKAENQQK